MRLLPVEYTDLTPVNNWYVRSHHQREHLISTNLFCRFLVIDETCKAMFFLDSK
jgi:hypothetical protein